MTINFWALIVCVIIQMVTGALWYSPMLFANSWMKEVGRKMEEMSGGTTGYVIAVVVDVVITLILSRFIDMAGVVGASSGAMIGFWAWLGFVLPPMVLNATFSGRSMRLVAIDSGLQLVNLVIVGAILAAWV